MTGGRNGKGYGVLATPFRCVAFHDTLLHAEKPPYRFHPYGGSTLICRTGRCKTTKNIKATEAFTISFADAKNVAKCDYVGIVSANNTPDKMEKAGFTVTKSSFVNAPIIEELPTLECRLKKVTEEGNIIGEIVNISVDDSILDENGQIDVDKLQPIAFDPVKNDYRVIGEKVGNAFEDGNKLK